MHALLLAAALAVGSGDGRDGATDGRMVSGMAPFDHLRVGMNWKDVNRVLCGRLSGIPAATWETFNVVLSVFRDPFAEKLDVSLDFDRGILARWVFSR
jgi:hypothetical protein